MSDEIGRLNPITSSYQQRIVPEERFRDDRQRRRQERERARDEKLEVDSTAEDEAGISESSNRIDLRI